MFIVAILRIIAKQEQKYLITNNKQPLCIKTGKEPEKLSILCHIATVLLIACAIAMCAVLC